MIVLETKLSKVWYYILLWFMDMVKFVVYYLKLVEVKSSYDIDGLLQWDYLTWLLIIICRWRSPISILQQLIFFFGGKSAFFLMCYAYVILGSALLTFSFTVEGIGMFLYPYVGYKRCSALKGAI